MSFKKYCIIVLIIVILAAVGYYAYYEISSKIAADTAISNMNDAIKAWSGK